MKSGGEEIRVTQKIAVAIIHGAGTPDENFAEALIERVKKEFAVKLSIPNAEDELEFQPIFWSAIFESEQKKMWEQLQESAQLDFPYLRRFVLEFLADAVAYQPTLLGDQNYHHVHSLVASSLQHLRKRAGSLAPLCIISHSLGTVVASNYFFDLQFRREQIGDKTRQCMGETPMEQCETLTLFYTMGSPLALWSLRYLDFGSPIHVPSPLISDHYPNVEGEWVNFYDKDDILAYPLKGVNEAYQSAVTDDVAVNAGGCITSWNPLSHGQYEKDDVVVGRITDGLVQIWKAINMAG